MAKETKFIEVQPSKTEKTISRWGNFGWELVGAPQEIYNRTSDTNRLERRGDKIYNVTERGETTHYVKITFQRDKNMPHYAEIADLEEKYYGTSFPSEPYRLRAGNTGGVLCIIIGALACCGGGVSGGDGIVAIIIGIVFITLGIMLSVKVSNKNKEYYSTWQEENDEWERKCGEIKKLKQDYYKRAGALIP